MKGSIAAGRAVCWKAGALNGFGGSRNVAVEACAGVAGSGRLRHDSPLCCRFDLRCLLQPRLCGGHIAARDGGHLQCLPGIPDLQLSPRHPPVAVGCSQHHLLHSRALRVAVLGRVPAGRILPVLGAVPTALVAAPLRPQLPVRARATAAAATTAAAAAAR